jgi:4-amino-4-deoxy-L-arabinose transferase-like glycosyltransferase
LVTGAIAAIAFVVRVGYVALTPHLPLRNDAADYDRLGRVLAGGHGFGSSLIAASGGPTAFRPPLYPAVLAVVYRLTGNSVIAGRLVQAALGAGAVVLIGLLARRVWGRRIALIAMGIAAVYPPLVLAGATLLSEPVFLCLFLGALILALDARRLVPGALVIAAAAGVLLGLATLARPVGLITMPAVAALAWRRHSARAWLPPVVLLVAAGLAIAPWTIRNALDLHAFVPVSTLDGFVLAGTYNDTAAHDPRFPAQYRPANFVPAFRDVMADRSLDEAELSAELRHRAVTYARHHLSYVPRTAWWNLRRLYDAAGWDQTRRANDAIGYGGLAAGVGFATYLLVLAAAVVGATTREARRAPLALWAIPVLVTLNTIAAVGWTRQRVPIEVFLVLLASLAVGRLPILESRRDGAEA